MHACEVTLPTIEFVCQAIKDNILPSLKVAKEYLDDTIDVTLEDQDIPNSAVDRRSLLMNYEPPTGVDVSADLAELELEGSQEVDDIDNLDEDHLIGEKEEEEETMYTKNNVTTDLPLWLDLNSTKGVMTVNDYFTGIADRCISQTTRKVEGELIQRVSEESTSHSDIDFDDDDGSDIARPGELFEYDLDELAELVSDEENPWAKNKWPLEHWPEPIMCESGAWICGDGNPTFAMKNLKQSHPKYMIRDFVAFNGRFHTMLESHKIRGKMFGPSHLREIWELW